MLIELDNNWTLLFSPLTIKKGEIVVELLSLFHIKGGTLYGRTKQGIDVRIHFFTDSVKYGVDSLDSLDEAIRRSQ